MSLNNRIKEARKKKGLSQEQLGELIGVAKTTVSGYENNHEPTAAKLGEIADVLSVDVNFLLQDEMKKIKKSSPVSDLIEAETLEPDERELVADYRLLNENGKEVARNAVHGFTTIPDYKKSSESKFLEENA